MKKIYLLVTILSVSIFSRAAEDILRERVYLQTDKQLYLAGELMWIKLITTTEKGVPLTFSKVGYIELLDATQAVVQVKVDIIEGVGEGWIVVPATLNSGNYRLVAYTRYMQNEGDKVFFSKILSIVNPFAEEVNSSVEFYSDSTSLSAPISYITNSSIKVEVDQVHYPSRTNGKVYISNIPNNTHTLSVSIAGIDDMVTTSSSNIEEWSKLLGSSNEQSVFSNNLLPEYEGHIITGKIEAITSTPNYAPKNIVPLLSFVGGKIRCFVGQVDENANVSFYTKHIEGAHEFALATISPIDANIRLTTNSPFAKHSALKLPALKINNAFINNILQRSVGLQVLHTYMVDSLSKFQDESTLFDWTPDSRYALDEYTRFPYMDETITEFIFPLRLRKRFDKNYLLVLSKDNINYHPAGSSLILLDGVPITNHELIYDYDPSLVREIEIYRDLFIFGKQVLNGIVLFKTYKENYPNLRLGDAGQIVEYDGTLAKRDFYTPSYQTEKEIKNRTPDFRHTLLWNPNVNTDNQPSVSVPFTTSDMVGKFLITVEGLTKDGKAISTSRVIEVIEK